MKLFSALARAAKRTVSGPFASLTRAQSVQLKKLDVVIGAQPNRPIPHFNRARYLDFCGVDFARVLEAIRGSAEDVAVKL